MIGAEAAAQLPPPAAVQPEDTRPLPPLQLLLRPAQQRFAPRRFSDEAGGQGNGAAGEQVPGVRVPPPLRPSGAGLRRLGVQAQNASGVAGDVMRQPRQIPGQGRAGLQRQPEGETDEDGLNSFLSEYITLEKVSE